MLTPETFNNLLDLRNDLSGLKEEVLDLENSYNIFYDMDEWKEEIENNGYLQLIEESIALLHSITHACEEDKVYEDEVFSSAFKVNNTSVRNKLAWFIKSLGKAQKQSIKVALLSFPLLEDVFSGVVKTDEKTLAIYRQKIQTANHTYLTPKEYNYYMELFEKDISEQYCDYEIDATQMTSKKLTEQLNLLLEDLKEEFPIALDKAISVMARDIAKAYSATEKEKRLLEKEEAKKAKVMNKLCGDNFVPGQIYLPGFEEMITEQIEELLHSDSEPKSPNLKLTLQPENNEYDGQMDLSEFMKIDS